MGMGFAPTWLRQVSPPPVLHMTTLTTAYRFKKKLITLEQIPQIIREISTSSVFHWGPAHFTLPYMLQNGLLTFRYWLTMGCLGNWLLRRSMQCNICVTIVWQMCGLVAEWLGSRLAINRSRVRILAAALPMQPWPSCKDVKSGRAVSMTTTLIVLPRF